MKNESVMCPHCHDVYEIGLIALVRKQNAWCTACEQLNAGLQQPIEESGLGGPVVRSEGLGQGKG